MLDYLRPSQQRTNHVLYRVRTPHQKVISLKVAEEDTTQARHRQHGASLYSGHARNQLFLPESSNQTARKGARSAGGVTSSFDGRSRRIRNVSCATAAQNDKQIRMTCCFQKAMAILDTIRKSQGLLVTSPRERKLFRNPLKVYNRWSQVWSREFKFQYA